MIEIALPIVLIVVFGGLALMGALGQRSLNAQIRMAREDRERSGADFDEKRNPKGWRPK